MESRPMESRRMLRSSVVVSPSLQNNPQRFAWVGLNYPNDELTVDQLLYKKEYWLRYGDIGSTDPTCIGVEKIVTGGTGESP